MLRDLSLRRRCKRVAEAGDARLVGRHVVDDLVVVVGARTAGNLVEPQRLPHAPGDVVVGARGVAADAEAADDAVRVVERQAAAEGDDAAERFADQRIVGRAEFRGVSRVKRAER